MTDINNLLCKGKRKDNNEWIEGYYCPKKTYCFDNRISSSHLIISEFSGTDYVTKEIDVNTLCQCTDIEDKKHNPIWTNDIVVDSYGKYYKIIYDTEEGSYMMEAGNCSLYGIDKINSSKFEVVGNIFDNPELIEKQEKNEIGMDKE